MSILAKINNGEYKTVKGTGLSNVWLYFEKITDTATGEILPYVICKTCKSTFSYAKGCSPSNLKKHRCYKRQHEQTGATDEEPKTMRLTVSDQIREDILENFVKFVTRDLRSVTTVDGDGFKELAHSLIETGIKLGTNKFGINDILPHSSTVSRRLNELHVNELEALVTTLRPIIEKGSCAGTIDIWTESKQQTNFITLTVHYLNDDWHLHSRILCTVEFQKCNKDEHVPKSAENIICALEEIFEGLKLPKNLHEMITFTTDQVSNVKEALQCHSWINCMAHVLNLILKCTFDKTVLEEGDPHILALITKCESLVDYLKRSGMTRMLETIVKQESPSRWNTKYEMCFSVHQNFNVIEDILEKSGELHRLHRIDKYLLDKIIPFLQLFKNVALLLESEKKPTIHLVLLHMHILKEKLQNLRNVESDNEMQYIITRCLDTVFDVEFVPHRIHKIAAFLWPSYKQLRYLNDVQRDEVFNIVKGELSNITKSNDTATTVSSESLSDYYEAGNSEEEDLYQYDDILNKYKDVHTMNDTTFSETQIAVEMELYKNSNYPDNNILRWWRDHETEFPLLAKLASQILCIPASSAASERCFSSADRVLEERRNNLEGNNVDAILFLHSMEQSWHVLNNMF